MNYFTTFTALTIIIVSLVEESKAFVLSYKKSAIQRLSTSNLSLAGNNYGNYYDRRFDGRGGDDANRWSNSLNQGNNIQYYKDNREYAYDNRWSNSLNQGNNIQYYKDNREFAFDNRWSNSIDPHRYQRVGGMPFDDRSWSNRQYGGIMNQYNDRWYNNNIDYNYGMYPNEGYDNHYYGKSYRGPNSMYPSYGYGIRNNYYYEDNMPRNYNNYRGYSNFYDASPYYSSNVMRGSNSEDPYGNNRQE